MEGDDDEDDDDDDGPLHAPRALTVGDSRGISSPPTNLMLETALCVLRRSSPGLSDLSPSALSSTTMHVRASPIRRPAPHVTIHKGP